LRASFPFIALFNDGWRRFRRGGSRFCRRDGGFGGCSSGRSGRFCAKPGGCCVLRKVS
jgi:hypothetical protein